MDVVINSWTRQEVVWGWRGVYEALGVGVWEAY